MRSGTRLGMPLETERRPVSARQTLQGPVEERDVRGSQIRGEGRWIDRKAMVLAGDDHLPSVEILHRMVSAVVAELHLQRLRAGGEAHDLVAKADAEDRDARGVENLADRLDGVVAGLGVARAVGE